MVRTPRAADIDFYVWEFHEAQPGPSGSLNARQRARDLVAAFRKLSPYDVDVYGIPGRPLDAPFEDSMRRDSIDLSRHLE